METGQRIVSDHSVVELWLQRSQRPQTSSVAERSPGGRKLCGTEALALVLGCLWSSWDHFYRLSGSGVKYFKDIFYIDECGGHVCIVI